MKSAQFDILDVGRDGFTVGLTVEMVHRLLDVLEDALDAGVAVHPAVYSMGEQLSREVDPGAWFGVEKKAA